MNGSSWMSCVQINSDLDRRASEAEQAVAAAQKEMNEQEAARERMEQEMEEQILIALRETKTIISQQEEKTPTSPGVHHASQAEQRVAVAEATAATPAVVSSEQLAVEVSSNRGWREGASERGRVRPIVSLSVSLMPCVWSQCRWRDDLIKQLQTRVNELETELGEGKSAASSPEKEDLGMSLPAEETLVGVAKPVRTKSKIRRRTRIEEATKEVLTTTVADLSHDEEARVLFEECAALTSVTSPVGDGGSSSVSPSAENGGAEVESLSGHRFGFALKDEPCEPSSPQSSYL